MLNLISLLTSDARAERIIGKVTADADACRFDHGGVLSWEGWALKLCVIHVTDMSVGLAVAMVLLNNLVEHWGERSVGVVAASIDTDSRVGVLGTREDCCLERDTTSVLLVLKQIPHSFVKILAEKRCGSSGENGKACDVFRFLEMGTSLAFLFSLGRSSCLCRGSATAELLLFSNHGFYAVVHVLNEIDLRATKSTLVGDIVDMISGLGVLTMDATDLNVELVGNLLEFSHLDAELRESNVN